MFSPKRDETRPGYEMRKEHIAIGVMILLCWLPLAHKMQQQGHMA